LTQLAPRRHLLAMSIGLLPGYLTRPAAARCVSRTRSARSAGVLPRRRSAYRSCTCTICLIRRRRTEDLRTTSVSRALLAGSKPALASGSRGGAGDNRWPLTAIRGHLGGTLVMRRPGARWSGAVARPSICQAGHIPSCGGSCECSALLPVAAAGRWSLRLMLPLLSATVAGRAVRL
jgi:hypothetical protein